MKLNKVRFCALLSAVFLLLCTLALAESAGPYLLLDLPADAQMIENVEFDNGDFVQTYQLSGGAHITLLRSQEMDMSITDLIESEWTGAENVSFLQVAPISEHPTQACSLLYPDESGTRLSVTLLTVQAEQYTLLYEAIYPENLGEDQIRLSIRRMIDSMTLTDSSLSELG
jgi:hypothetical protein